MNPKSRCAMVLFVGSGPSAEAALRECEETLATFGIEARWVTESEDPTALRNSAESKASLPCAVIVASPDGTLPGVWARSTGLLTLRIPVAGGGKTALELLKDGDDQLPHGSGDAPFATMAIGAAGAKNAALFAVATLALNDPALFSQWAAFRARQTAAVLDSPALPLGFEPDTP